VGDGTDYPAGRPRGNGGVKFFETRLARPGAGVVYWAPAPYSNRRGPPRQESPMYKYAWYLVDWVLGLVGVTDVPGHVDID